LLTFLSPFDADALPILSAPHQFRCGETVSLAGEGDVLVFSNGHRRLRTVGVEDIWWHCNITRKRSNIFLYFVLKIMT
jgi:hypothetical protein